MQTRRKKRGKSQQPLFLQSTLQPPPLPHPLLELYWALMDARDAGTCTHQSTHCKNTIMIITIILYSYLNDTTVL